MVKRMDILEWVFRERPWEQQLSEVEALRSSIKAQLILFDDLWRAHQTKLSAIKAIAEGYLPYLKDIPELNNIIITNFKKILEGINFKVLIKKILYESTERLHEIEVFVWRYGGASLPAWDPTTGEKIVPKVEIKPYNIESAKRAIWSIVKDKQELEDFIRDASKQLLPELEALKKLYNEQLEPFLREQSDKAGSGIWTGFNTDENERYWKQEGEIILQMKRILSDIINKTIVMARLWSRVEIEELKTKEEFIKEVGQKVRKKVGVMLISQISGTPYQMSEFENFLKSMGYITYNVRLPGHATSLEELFNTPVDEIERFLISQFNFFYQAMKKINNGDGRFYIAGNSLGAMMPLHIMAKSWKVAIKTENSAKKFNEKIGETVTIHPYQDMVKGIISISAATSLAAGPLPFGVGPPMINLGTKVAKNPIASKILTPIMALLAGRKIRKEGIVDYAGSVHIKIEGIKKRIDPDLEPDRFYEAVRNEIKPLIQGIYRKKIAKINNLKLKNIINKKIEEIKQEINPNLYPDRFYETAKKEIELIRETFRGMSTEISEMELNSMVEQVIDNVKKGLHAFAGESLMGVRPLQEKMRGQSVKTLLGGVSKLISQLREDVKHIYIPILILQGLHDSITHPSSADYIYNNVKTNPKFKKKRMLEGSGHTPQLDFDKDIVFEESVKFIEMVEESEKVPVYG
ncbi:hypothetical protein HYX02_06260 [Candidatus Woesearchaeota archaeon]|nr:hypothetical protein [Candidatus Woesearchaeota archaeon]